MSLEVIISDLGIQGGCKKKGSAGKLLICEKPEFP
jgi:hypothetical protein